jgi:hypothetical protein
VALSRCVARFALKITDSGDKIDLRGRDRGQISLLDPAICHPTARRDPRWAGVGFDERFPRARDIPLRGLGLAEARDRDRRREIRSIGVIKGVIARNL